MRVKLTRDVTRIGRLDMLLKAGETITILNTSARFGEYLVDTPKGNTWIKVSDLEQIAEFCWPDQFTVGEFVTMLRCYVATGPHIKHLNLTQAALTGFGIRRNNASGHQLVMTYFKDLMLVSPVVNFLDAIDNMVEEGKTWAEIMCVLDSEYPSIAERGKL